MVKSLHFVTVFGEPSDHPKDRRVSFFLNNNNKRNEKYSKKEREKGRQDI